MTRLRTRGGKAGRWEMRTVVRKANLPTRVFLVASALATSSLLAGCATGPSSSEALRRDYGEVEIDRLGGLRPTDKERQNTAIRNAIAYVEARQVPRDAVERVTVENDRQSGPLFGNDGLLGKQRPYRHGAATMRLWVTLADCDRDLLFTASSTGHLTSVSDEGRCLSAGTAPPAAPPPGWGVIKDIKPAPREALP